MFAFLHYLHGNIDQNDHEGVCQVEKEPLLDGFDDTCVWQRGGHRQVDGGEDHHARDVDGVQQVVPGLTDDVVAGIVDDVHEDRGEVSYHKYTKDFQLKIDSNNYCFQTLLSS